jgi:cytochrome P450
VVEEGLRYDGPIQGVGRLSQCPAQIQGYDIQEGERVFGSYTAVSHDPEIYERPDEFVVGRNWRNLPPHMGFGYGIHHCIGANLARLEAAQESLPALLAVQDRRAWLREDFDLATAGREDVGDAAAACPWFAITVEEQYGRSSPRG